MKQKAYATFKKIDYKTLITYLVITVLFFGVLCITEYALDTYNVYTEGASKSAAHFMSDGRFVSALATLLCNLLKLNYFTTYRLSYCLAIACATISMYVLDKLIKDDIKNNTLRTITSTLIVINPFIIELFLFIEKGILILSILLNILAVKYISKNLETKNKKYLLISALLMFFAIGSYQGTAGLFVAISLVYILKYSKNIKEFLINNIKVACVYGISAVLDLIIIKVSAVDRVSGNVVLIDSIKKVFAGSKNLFGLYNIVPKYLYWFIVLVLLVVAIYFVIKNKKSKILNAFKLLYLLLGVYAVSVVPQMIQDTESIWMVPRSTFPFASVMGIIILFIYTIIINHEDDGNKNVKKNSKEKSKEIKKENAIYFKIEKLIIIISVCYLAIQYYNFCKIEVSRYKLNAIDKEITNTILAEINEYETTSGNTISKIVICHDKYIEYTYEGLFVTGDMNIRTYSTDWSTKAALNFIGNREFEIVEGDNEIINSFSEKEWKHYDESQIIIKDNVLYLCTY